MHEYHSFKNQIGPAGPTDSVKNRPPILSSYGKKPEMNLKPVNSKNWSVQFVKPKTGVVEPVLQNIEKMTLFLLISSPFNLSHWCSSYFVAVNDGNETSFLPHFENLRSSQKGERER